MSAGAQTGGSAHTEVAHAFSQQLESMKATLPELPASDTYYRLLCRLRCWLLCWLLCRLLCQQRVPLSRQRRRRLPLLWFGARTWRRESQRGGRSAGKERERRTRQFAAGAPDDIHTQGQYIFFRAEGAAEQRELGRGKSYSSISTDQPGPKVLAAEIVNPLPSAKQDPSGPDNTPGNNGDKYAPQAGTPDAIPRDIMPANDLLSPAAAAAITTNAAAIADVTSNAATVDGATVNAATNNAATMALLAPPLADRIRNPFASNRFSGVPQLCRQHSGASSLILRRARNPVAASGTESERRYRGFRLEESPTG